MSSQVHPGPGAAPQTVASGTVSEPIELADHAAPDPVTGRTVLFIQVVQVRDDDVPAPQPPSLRLSGGAGTPVPVEKATPIPAGGPPIALATRIDQGSDIHLVEVEVLVPQTRWRLHIGNTDARPHRYVVVAGSTVAETRRPWLDLPVDALAFAVRLGETVAPRELPVANHGSGPLTPTDQDGAALGAGFTLLAVTPRPIGANRTGTARIGFTAPPQPVDLAIEHTFASDDPGAGATTGHNNRVALTATVTQAPRWSAGDIVRLGELSLDRLDRTTGAFVPVGTETAGAVDVAVDPTTGDAVLLGAGFVKRVDRLTGVQSPLPGVSSLTAPVGVGVERDGTVVVLDKQIGLVVRVRPTGDHESVAVRGLGNPQDMALEADGDIVLVYGLGGDAKVARISRSGSLTTVASGEHLSGPVGGPLAVAVEHDGTILTARRFQGAGGGITFSAGDLIRVDPRSGHQQRYIGKGVLSEPSGLAVAADGTILVAAGSGLFAVHPQAGQSADPARLSTTSGGRIAVVPPLAG